MIETAVQLMRERGVEATSFAEVLAASEAPRGSIYHHFPDGKAQLIEEATRWAGQFIAGGERAALREGPVAAVRLLAAYWRSVLRDSDFLAGCPIVAVTVEGELRPAAREAAGDVFDEWEALFARALRDEGVAPRRARSLATMVIASVEGGVILARAQRSLTPFNRVAAELEALVAAALEHASSP